MLKARPPGRAFFVGYAAFEQVCRWNSWPSVLSIQECVKESGAACVTRTKFSSGGGMDKELRKRLDDFFDVGFGKTTGIDTALEITKIYAGSAAADPDKIPDLFVRLVQLFEPRLDVRD